MRFKLSKKSKERLSTCHKDLRLVIETSIKVSSIDFGVSEGYRTVERQNKLFKKGRSKIDGVNKKGKHNYSPSLAVDVYAFINGNLSYDKESMSFIAGVIIAVSEILLEQGKTSHKIRWGGNWDMDGVILIDQSFDDRPHFELVKP